MRYESDQAGQQPTSSAAALDTMIKASSTVTESKKDKNLTESQRIKSVTYIDTYKRTALIHTQTKTHSFCYYDSATIDESQRPVV